MAGAVCLTSGGQDSTTCLFWAKQRFDPILALAFDYGQRHRIELEAARVVCDLAGIRAAVVAGKNDEGVSAKLFFVERSDEKREGYPGIQHPACYEQMRQTATAEVRLDEG